MVNPIKSRNFCSIDVPVKRMKRHVTEIKKISENHMYDKTLIFRIHKELPKLK